MEKMRPTTDFGVLSPYLWRYRVLMEFFLKTRVLIGYFEVTWHIFIIHLKYFAISDWLKSLFISSQAFIQYPSLLSVFHSFFSITSSDFSRTMFDESTDQWLIQGKGPETRSPPYFWTKLRLEGRKMFLRRPALPFIYGSGWPSPPPPHLKVWIRHYRSWQWCDGGAICFSPSCKRYLNADGCQNYHSTVKL